MYWVFNESQLIEALAAFEARRQSEGASEQQTHDDTALIALFLASPEAERAKLCAGKGWHSRIER